MRSTRRLSFLLGVLTFLLIAATTDQIIQSVYDSASAALRVKFAAGAQTLAGPITLSDAGTANAPAFGIADTLAPMGMFKIAQARLGFTVNGGNPLELQANVAYFKTGAALFATSVETGQAWQLGGLDASGALPTTTLTTADQTGTGAGGSFLIRPGDAAGVDQAGAALVLYGGSGTGTGLTNAIQFYTPDSTVSGSTLQAQVLRWTIYGGVGTLIPAPDAARDIGTPALRVKNFYQSGFHMLSEIADPAAAAADRAYFYIKDNGAGKTQLAVRFATGVVQVIATEP